MDALGKMFSVGDAAGWSGGVAQATAPTSDLRPQVDGGNPGAAQANASADPDAKTTLYWSAGIVLTAILILWMGGATIFKGSNF